jgi:hypothetical protein
VQIKYIKYYHSAYCLNFNFRLGVRATAGPVLLGTRQSSKSLGSRSPRGVAIGRCRDIFGTWNPTKLSCAFLQEYRDVVMQIIGAPSGGVFKGALLVVFYHM